jgi:heat shock protein HtpX
VDYFGDLLAAAYHAGRNGGEAIPAAWGTPGVAMVPDGQCGRFPRLVVYQNAIFLETNLAGPAGWALVCRMPAKKEDFALLQRAVQRGTNDRRYAQMMAGMVLLLALCGWIVGGDEAARWIVEEASRPDGASVVSPELIAQRFGARQMHGSEWPALFTSLRNLCRRAGLLKVPELYCLAAPSMNAYALGGPEKSAIIVTEGLLRGMSIDEIASILAHEIAHIRSNDGRATALTAALRRAIGLASHLGLMGLYRRNRHLNQSLIALLSTASTIAQLLYLALSRIQEIDADGLAAELIGDPKILATALYKLECHYGGFALPPASPPEPGVGRYLRSHPATHERVGMLLGLAAWTMECATA